MTTTNSQTVDNNRLDAYEVEKIPGPNGAIQVVTSGFSLPKFDNKVFSYNGDGDLSQIDYYLDSNLVATIEFSYTDGNLTGQQRTL